MTKYKVAHKQDLETEIQVSILTVIQYTFEMVISTVHTHAWKSARMKMIASCSVLMDFLASVSFPSTSPVKA
jgi:hypothetical protein